jgi:hypothetical protein
MQVGLLTDRDAAYWFALGFGGIQCLAGSVYWRDSSNNPIGCRGDPNSSVGINEWQTFELVAYAGQGKWIARVFDSNNNPTDVATFPISDTRIYRAIATTEEAWRGSTDPYMEASFYYNHPRYKPNGSGDFQVWPASTFINVNARSYIWTSTLNDPLRVICPYPYGANPLISYSDLFTWFAGTGGQVCNWNLFSIYASNNFLPMITN